MHAELEGPRSNRCHDETPLVHVSLCSYVLARGFLVFPFLRRDRREQSATPSDGKSHALFCFL